VIDQGRLVEQGEPAQLLARYETESLEDVFMAVTGRRIHEHEYEDEGRLSDVRAKRRVARRLG
jgi:hypothetical protein